jgi:thiamine biosynthesis protein ThiI
LSSPEIEREVGGRIKEARNWTVNLARPELTIRVEALTHEAFYSFGTIRGAGGLPVGASGRVACLLSGGIDSPVAAWRMMRRGCRVLFVHFHSYPILSRASQEKARELAKLLTRFQYHSRLFVVPFGEIQQRVVLAVPPPLRVVVYRRLMMRIGERIARMHRAQGLVTGDVVGQVASQTLENMATIGSVVTIPVLRPLVGMDKDEITAEAIRLGTYPISIIPDQDCCTLFTPRHPATKAKPHEVERAEAELPVAEMVAQAVAAAEIEHFRFPDIK